MTGAVISNAMMPNSEVVSILTAEFLTPAEVAALLKVSRKALADWRLKRQGPPFILRQRGVVVYPAESFKRYLREACQKDCRERFSTREPRWSRSATMNLPNSPAHAAATGCGTGNRV